MSNLFQGSLLDEVFHPIMVQDIQRSGIQRPATGQTDGHLHKFPVDLKFLHILNRTVCRVFAHIIGERNNFLYVLPVPFIICRMAGLHMGNIAGS